MKKLIQDMTAADKASFLEAMKKAMISEHGMPWEQIESKIQANINATFDDEKFARMDPDSCIDAAYARKAFGNKKPDLVDYLLWSATFVTRCDGVEW